MHAQEGNNIGIFCRIWHCFCSTAQASAMTSETMAAASLEMSAVSAMKRRQSLSGHLCQDD